MRTYYENTEEQFERKPETWVERYQRCKYCQLKARIESLRAILMSDERSEEAEKEKGKLEKELQQLPVCNRFPRHH